MARHKNTATLPPEPDLDQARTNNAMVVMRKDAAASAMVVAEHNERVAALATQLKYAGATDPATLENSAREAIRRIGMGIFELGAYLLLLRETCEHGTFLPTLERLGIGTSAAGRYMAVTRRFAANSATSRNLETAGMSRLVELLPLDDEQLEELTELGQTGELKLDDVASMTVKELRAAVREERQEHEATKAVAQKKQELIEKQARTLVRFEKAKPDEKLAELQRCATVVMNDAVGCIRGALRQAVIGLGQHGDERGLQDRFIASMVAEVQAALNELRTEFKIPDRAGEDEPEFSKAVNGGQA